MFAETQQLAVKLDLKGNFKAGLRDASRSLLAIDKATGRTQRSLSKFGGNIQKGITVGLAATTAGFLGVVKAASDYESAFAGVRKTVSATEPQLAELSKQFRDLAKQIPISASELARLGEAGGALGVPTDQLKEFVRVTALLGVTTNLTADEAADSLGVLGNVLKLTGKEYERFASSLVALGNAGASTERDIVAIAERAGAAGELIGVSTEQILGFSSAVASLGIEAEAGGTAIQKFFIDSAKSIAEGGDELKIFAKTAGVSAKAFQKAFKNDAGGALQDFLEGLGKLPQAQQLAVLEDLGFNDARITRTLLGLANNTKLVSDQMNVANKAFKENTALTKEAEQRFNTFDSQLQITKNVLSDIAITIGSKLLPKITPLLKRLNDFVNANQDKIEEFGANLASGFEKFADALGKVNWQPFIDGLRITADIAKTAIGLFMALPAEVKAVAIGAFAVNKVTGGLGTSIIKDAGGALLKQFAARGSSPANPMWVAMAGGPAPAAPPGSPPGGGLAAGLKGLAKLAGGIGLAVIGIEALGALINATSTPEQRAAGEANAIEQNRLKRGLNVKTLPVNIVGVKAGLLDRGGRETGRPTFGAGKQKDDRVNLAQLARGTNALLADGFRQMVGQLKGAKTPKEVQAAVAKAVELAITKGRGNVEATKTLLAGLKDQLTNTSDPETRRVLAAAIAKVTAKIPGREYVQKQIAKADAILNSNKTTAQKIEALKQIQSTLTGKSVTAVNAVSAKIEQAKRQQVYASQATTQAIKDKDLSVRTTVNNAISVISRISVAETIKTQTTYKKIGNVYVS